MTTQSVRDLTTKLKALQAIDLEIRKLRKEEERWPAILSSRDRELGEKKARLKAAEDAQQQHKMEVRKRELSLKALEEQTVKLNVQLNAVKNNKEYKALLNEIAFKKSETSGIEEEILRIMEKVDKAALDVAAAKAVLNASQEEKDKVAAQAKTEIGEIRSEVAGFDKRRTAALEGIPKDMLERYERIARSRDGMGIAAVVEGVCHGCYLNLTAQEINVLMGGDELLTCRSCSRMLYLDS